MFSVCGFQDSLIDIEVINTFCYKPLGQCLAHRRGRAIPSIFRWKDLFDGNVVEKRFVLPILREWFRGKLKHPPPILKDVQYGAVSDVSKGFSDYLKTFFEDSSISLMNDFFRLNKRSNFTFCLALV